MIPTSTSCHATPGMNVALSWVRGSGALRFRGGPPASLPVERGGLLDSFRCHRRSRCFFRASCDKTPSRAKTIALQLTEEMGQAIFQNPVKLQPILTYPNAKNNCSKTGNLEESQTSGPMKSKVQSSTLDVGIVGSMLQSACPSQQFFLARVVCSLKS